MEEMVTRFRAAAEKVGCQVTEASSLREAGERSAGIARTGNAHLLLTASEEMGERLELARALRDSGIRVSGPDPAELLMADVGLAAGLLGVVETGSILLEWGSVDARLATFLPPICIVLLGCGDLVESLEEGLAVTRLRILSTPGRASYLTWMTGPSRTADIERALTIGVHGPQEVHLILLPSLQRHP